MPSVPTGTSCSLVQNLAAGARVEASPLRRPDKDVTAESRAGSLVTVVCRRRAKSAIRPGLWVSRGRRQPRPEVPGYRLQATEDGHASSVHLHRLDTTYIISRTVPITRPPFLPVLRCFLLGLDEAFSPQLPSTYPSCPTADVAGPCGPERKGNSAPEANRGHSFGLLARFFPPRAQREGQESDVPLCQQDGLTD